MPACPSPFLSGGGLQNPSTAQPLHSFQGDAHLLQNSPCFPAGNQAFLAGLRLLPYVEHERKPALQPLRWGKIQSVSLMPTGCQTSCFQRKPAVSFRDISHRTPKLCCAVQINFARGEVWKTTPRFGKMLGKVWLLPGLLSEYIRARAKPSIDRPTRSEDQCRAGGRVISCFLL